MLLLHLLISIVHQAALARAIRHVDKLEHLYQKLVFFEVTFFVVVL